MINKRKLDELIDRVTDEPERQCAYSFEDYCSNKYYQKHVCGFVRNCCMPYSLAKYLYNDCYYDDVETVQANIDYVNSVMPEMVFYETWVDMTMELVIEEIETIKADEAKQRAIRKAECAKEDDLFDALFDEPSVTQEIDSDAVKFFFSTDI